MVEQPEAEERTIQMLNLYADFCEEVLAMPVIFGWKVYRKLKYHIGLYD